MPNKRFPPAKPFAIGNPGGPGRPKGSRNALSEAFIRAVFEDFQAHGAAAIAAARERDPLGYIRMVAGLMPAKIEVATGVRDMTDEELMSFVRSGDGPVRH